MTTRHDDYPTLTMVFCVERANEFIDFCTQALGAEERTRRPGPNDSVMHADLKLGDTIFWVTEAIKDPPTTNSVACFVRECDATYEKAVAAGATPVFPPADTPWGARWARVEDRWGNRWTFTTRPARAPGG